MGTRVNFGADRERLHPTDRGLLHMGLIGLLLVACVQVFNHNVDPANCELDAASNIGPLVEKDLTAHCQTGNIAISANAQQE